MAVSRDTLLLDLRYQWHPRLREEWAHERLYFWWLGGFPVYDRHRILEQLRRVLAYNNVSAYAVYELYGGGYDILLRAWLSTTHRPVTQTMEQAFGSSLIVEHFSVDEVVAHWPWMDRPGGELRQPDDETIRRPLPAEEITRINSRTMTTDECHDMEKRHVIAPAPHQQGIKFVTLITPNTEPRSLNAWKRMRRQLTEILDAANSVSERSLYHGMGFGRFLIMGRVSYPDFHKIAHELTEPINDRVVPATFGARTTTFLVSTEDFLDFFDEMHLPHTTPPQRPVAELLQDEESQLLEVKGSAFVDLNRWLHTSAPPDSSEKVNGGLLKSVVGMLNAEGGTIVVGALERGRYADFEALAEKPVCGTYVCIGVELDYLGHDWDHFERRLRQVFSDRIRGQTTEWIRITRDGLGPLPMCVITVTSPERRRGERNRWFYHYPEGLSGAERFWVRQGNRTVELRGPDIDEYKDDKGH